MTSETTLHRHPIRGLIWGLVFGLGVTGLLIVFSVVELSISSLVSYTVAITVASVLWGLVGPPKKPKGPTPARHAPPAAASASPPAAPMAAAEMSDAPAESALMDDDAPAESASMDDDAMEGDAMGDDGEETAG